MSSLRRSRSRSRKTTANDEIQVDVTASLASCNHPAAIELEEIHPDANAPICPACHPDDRMDVNRLIPFIFLALEWLLGMICFAVEVGYEVCTLFIRYYSYHYLEQNAREYLVRTRLVYSTVTAFPLFILPIIIIPMFITKRSMPSSMFILLGLIGCGCYIASGAVTLASANLTWVTYSATQAFGALAITTGIVYLAHCAYEILRNRDDDVD